MLGYLLFTGACYLRDPLFSQYINMHIAPNNRATVLSALSVVFSAYIVIMQLIVGAVSDINIEYALLLIGIIIVIGAILLRIDERHVQFSQGETA